jgi:bacterioferritin
MFRSAVSYNLEAEGSKEKNHDCALFFPSAQIGNGRTANSNKELVMNKEKVLQALNLDLEHEMTSIVRYLHHSFIVAGPIRAPLVSMFRQMATDSMQHAVKLGEKIVALGGHPSIKIQEIYEPGDQTIEEMLSENLQAEKEHLALYEKQLELVKDNTPLRLMLEQVVVEESGHIDELEMYLRHDAVTKSKAATGR